MKRYIKAVPGKGIVASKQINRTGKKVMCSEIAGASEDAWKDVADNYILLALEYDSDSHSYEINSPEHAAVAGLNQFKGFYDSAKEDGDLEEWLADNGLPTDLVLTKQLAKELMPIFTEVASKYDFDSYDDSFEDW